VPIADVMNSSGYVESNHEAGTENILVLPHHGFIVGAGVDFDECLGLDCRR
jgi:hypothetical protein